MRQDYHFLKETHFIMNKIQHFTNAICFSVDILVKSTTSHSFVQRHILSVKKGCLPLKSNKSLLADLGDPMQCGDRGGQMGLVVCQTSALYTVLPLHPQK